MPHDDPTEFPSALRRCESIAPQRWQMVFTLKFLIATLDQAFVATVRETTG